MASATENSEEGESPGVDFIREDDGTITAQDEQTGLARGGETRADALAQLAEVLALNEGRREPINNPERFLREELELEPESTERDPPEFLG